MIQKNSQYPQLTISLLNEDQTILLGHYLSVSLDLNLQYVMYLKGDLGVGKTTLSRAIIKKLEVEDNVKSPTFTLIESYQSKNNKLIVHMDLYRISDPEELAFIGLDQYIQANLLLVEWPDKGDGYLPHADLIIEFKEHANHGRLITLTGYNDKAYQLLERMRFFPYPKVYND